MAQKTYLDWARPLREKHDYDDYGFLVMLEGASLIIAMGGVPTFTILTQTLSWAAPMQLVSPVTGKIITIAAGSVVVADGHVLVVRGVDFPISNDATKTLTAHAPSSSEAKRFGNIFFGCRRGNTVYLRPGIVVSGV